MPIKALIRLALVCLTVVLIAKPHPAPINKQVLAAETTKQIVTQVDPSKPQPTKAVVAEAKVETPKPAPQQERPVPVATPPVQALPTNKTDLMRLAGIPESDWNATDYIVSKESSWNYQAQNSSSGAYGLCQALPASKMASISGDYLTNPITQLKWCHQYATTRYGGWWASFAFWRANSWW